MIWVNCKIIPLIYFVSCQTALVNFRPIFYFYIFPPPQERQKTRGFNVFRGYRNGILTRSELSNSCKMLCTFEGCHTRKHFYMMLLYVWCRPYSSYFMHAIAACMRLPFFKIFSNFVHFCPNFQIFCPFLLFFCPFSEKSHTSPYILE